MKHTFITSAATALLLGLGAGAYAQQGTADACEGLQGAERERCLRDNPAGGVVTSPGTDVNADVEGSEINREETGTATGARRGAGGQGQSGASPGAGAGTGAGAGAGTGAGAGAGTGTGTGAGGAAGAGAGGGAGAGAGGAGR